MAIEPTDTDNAAKTTAAAKPARKPATRKPAAKKATAPKAAKAPAARKPAAKRATSAKPGTAKSTPKAAPAAKKKSSIGFKTALAAGIGTVGAVATAALLTLRGSTPKKSAGPVNADEGSAPKE